MEGKVFDMFLCVKEKKNSIDNLIQSYTKKIDLLRS